jgi:hypothetical protein
MTKKLDGTTSARKVFFFELPYWKDLLVRHNLDVMHIEKNICESILGLCLGSMVKLMTVRRLGWTCITLG